MTHPTKPTSFAGTPGKPGSWGGASGEGGPARSGARHSRFSEPRAESGPAGRPSRPAPRPSRRRWSALSERSASVDAAGGGAGVWRADRPAGCQPGPRFACLSGSRMEHHRSGAPFHSEEAGPLDMALPTGGCCGVMAVGIELERVRRKSGGRIHLTPHVPDSGRAVTLCNQSFAEGTFLKTGEEADCRNCLRRRDDPARVSSAFFQSDVGSELLQRSLEEARSRRATRSEPERVAPPPAPDRPRVVTPPAATPAQPPPAPAPPVSAAAPAIRELRSHTPLRRTFENVFTSPQGVVVRVSKDGSVSHVTFEGPVDIRRRGREIAIRVGDVVLELDDSGQT